MASPQQTPRLHTITKPSFLDEQQDFSLVLGGPIFQLFRRSHLAGDHLELLYRRLLIITLFAWLPLLQSRLPPSVGIDGRLNFRLCRCAVRRYWAGLVHRAGVNIRVKGMLPVFWQISHHGLGSTHAQALAGLSRHDETHRVRLRGARR